MAAARLEVTVIGARNLYNSDGFLAGKSDPYCIVEVPGQPQMKFQTHTLNNTLEPVWNFTGEINGFMGGDTLEFQVWDSDTWPKPDQLLGRVALDANHFYPDGLEGELELQESKTQAGLTVRIVVLDTATEEEMAAPIDQTVAAEEQPFDDASGGAQAQMYVEGPQALRVNIVNARGLYNADGLLAGKSDPYCICMIPGKPDSKFQTKIMSNTLEPDWNDTGIIYGFESGDSLEFQVWDSDTFPKRDQLLGQVTLSPQDFDNHPDGIAGQLPLSGGKATETSFLEIVVQANTNQLEEADAVPEPEAPAQTVTTLTSHGPSEAHRIDHLNGARMAKLKITIFRASGLYDSDGFLAGKSDPYCVVFVQERPHVKSRTKTINNCLEPVWNHLSVVNGFVVGEAIEFQVWDSDTKPKPDQLLGRAVLRSEDFVPYGVEGELQLAESKSLTASISVRIEVLPDAAATGLSGAVLAEPAKTGGGQVPTGGRIISTTVIPGSPAQYQRVSAAAVPSAVFDMLDRNHDGVITRSEFGQGLMGAATRAVTQAAVPASTTTGQPYPIQGVMPASTTTAQSYSIPSALASPATKIQDLSAGRRILAAPTVYSTAPVAAYTASAGSARAPVTTMSASSAAAMVSAPSQMVTMSVPPPVSTTGFPSPVTTVSPPPPMTTVSAASPVMTMGAPSPVTPAGAPSPVTTMAAPLPVATMGVPSPVATVGFPSPARTAGAPSPMATLSAPSAVTTLSSPSPVTTLSAPSPVATVRAPAVTMATPSTTVMAPAAFQSGAMMYAPAAQGTAVPAASYTLPAASKMTFNVAQAGGYKTGTGTSSILAASKVTHAAPQGQYAMPVAAMPTQPGTIFDKLDANHDGVITRSEFAAAVR